MKFQLKLLAAALALSAATLPAQAAISTASTGDSSMVLTLLDFTDGISSVYNLGFTYSQFDTLVSDATANGGTYSWDIASSFGSTWSTFWSTAQASNTQWAIYAGDNTGNGVGARGMIETIGNVNPASTTKTQLTTYLTNAMTNFDKYLTPNSAYDSATATAGAGYAGTANAYGATGRVGGLQGIDSNNPLDTSMSVQQLLSGATAVSAPGITTLGNTSGDYTFTMSSAGVLTFNVPVITPVPEADSYAMLLAGLAVVGAVARRRKA